MPARPVGFAATVEFADLDDGWPLLQAALAAHGLAAVPFTWDGDGRPPSDVEAVLVNYAWGYVSNRDGFLAWAERTAAETRLLNPLPVLRWNSDKTYLADLAAAGIPTVPTTFVTPGQDWSPPSADFVVKPTVGSGGWLSARYVDADAAAHVRALHDGGRTAMVQPYQRSVDAGGETAMLFFHRSFSHAIRKGPLLEPDVGMVDALWEREVITPVEPPAAHLDLARRALDAAHAVAGPTAYARVDVVELDDGTPAVLELELVEPSPFLPTDPGAADRFAAALSEILGPPALR